MRRCLLGAAVSGWKLESQGVNLSIQRSLVHSQSGSGLAAVEMGLFEGLPDDAAFQAFQGVVALEVQPRWGRGGSHCVGKVIHCEVWPRGHDEGVFDDVLEFSDVAWEVVVEEELHKVRAGSSDVLFVEMIEALKEVVDEERDVHSAISQRGKGQLHDVDSIVEILAELSGNQHLFEVSVGRCDHPGVGVLGVVGSQGVILSFLENSQQLHLDCGGYVSQFIQEDGASIGLCESPLLIPLGAGKRPPFVSEQLGFQQCFGERSAIHRDEGTAFSRAEIVNRSGSELFSRAAFPAKQHRAVGFGSVREIVEDFAHARTAGHDIVDCVALVELLAKLRNLSQISDGLHPADDGTVGGPKEGSRDAHRAAMSFLVHQEDLFAGNRCPGLHGLSEDALTFADVCLQHLTAHLPQGFFARDPCEGFCGSIEVGDSPLIGDGEHPFGDVVQDDCCVGFVHRVRPSSG